MSDDTTNPTPADQPAQPADELTAILRQHGANDQVIENVHALGATTVEHLTMLDESHLTGAGLNVIQARSLLKAVAPDLTAGGAAVSDSADLIAARDILPKVPDDGSWLKALQTGGVLKVNEATLVAAIRAALAKRVGLFDIPDKLVKLMEAHAEAIEEQVDETFFAVHDQLVRRSYAEIFSAVPGLTGRFVTDRRKQELFTRMERLLWPAVLGFDERLGEWQQELIQSGFLSAMMNNAFGAPMGGLALPAGLSLTQLPDTSALRDYAAEVVNAVNKVFAGFGVQIASAMAYDATEIRKVLQNNRLPSLIGAANREQMLRELGVAVGPAYPRIENALTQYVMAVMEVPNQPAGMEANRYFIALLQLGRDIPWETLGGKRGAPASHPDALTSIGGAPLLQGRVLRDGGRGRVTPDQYLKELGPAQRDRPSTI